jgi:hypothetical protein
MRINDLLLESTIKNDPIFEDIYRGSKLLAELKLSNDQITKIFQAVADGAAKGQNDGSNRTVLGKGADAVTSVSQAFEKVKAKISQSGPVSGFDAAFDKMQSEILKAAGGDSGPVGQAITKYREFAKAHPVMQGAIYAGLVALAGISGAGLGGAALLGGIKLFDRLLQGDKASSALWQGFKTGATAYAAGKIGQAMKGDEVSTAADATTNVGGALDPKYQQVINTVKDNPSYTPEYKEAFIKALKDEAASFPSADPETVRASIDAAKEVAQEVAGSMYTSAAKKTAGNLAGESITLSAPAIVEYIDRQATVWTWALNEGLGRSHGGVMLTTAGVNKIFETIVNEGPFSDKIKAGAGKVAGAIGAAAKRGWEDASNKITYNKLDLNWRRGEGRNQTGPVDSEVLAAFLRKQGVADGLLSSVYKSMKVPFKPASEAQPTADTTTVPRVKQQSTQSAAPSSTTTPSARTPSSASPVSSAPSGSTYLQIKNSVKQLDTKSKKRLLVYLQKQFPQVTPSSAPIAKKKTTKKP